MSYSILHRYTDAVLYASETADSIASAVLEAIKNGADLSGAYLNRADLSGANLSGANLDAWSMVIPASRHVITAYPDRVQIGCHSREIDSWLKIYERVGREEGYTAEQIAEYGEHLRRIKALTNLMTNAIETAEGSKS